MELKKKGSNAVIGGFKQLQVSLIWTAGVDLDLMAFYKTKSGETGGVYSANYAGGSLGNLNAFPFIELSGDAGVGGAAGDNREIIRISKIDDLEELWIAAVNFSDAVSGANKVFADYDAKVEVTTDAGENHTVSLDSQHPGSVAVLCQFKADFMGSSLVNNSDVMPFDVFQATVPGASAVQLSSKVILKQKGDKVTLAAKGFQATMRWKAAVDLDLHCYFKLKSGAPEPKKGLLGKLLKSGPSDQGHVYFAGRGKKDDSPWIYLDKDAGVGDRGGDNQENIYFTNLDQIEHALIVANIFGKPNANFASFDGLVAVRCGSQEIDVPLIEKTPGSWCIIARLDNGGGAPQLININKTVGQEPKLADFI